MVEVLKREPIEQNGTQMSALYGWLTSRYKMRDYFNLAPIDKGKGYAVEDIEELLKGETRLICLSISKPTTLKQVVIDLTHSMLLNRKREFTVKPHLLFVWDEAQEVVSAPSNLGGIDRTSSEEVERLL